MKRAPSWFGFGLAVFVALAAAYEALAIDVGPLPTWSRMFQGIRDTGTLGTVAVWVLTLGIVAGVIRFLVWLVPHWLREKRSEL